MTAERNPNVTYFDLDAVAAEDIVVVIKGVEHHLVPVSVDDFVANTRLVAKLQDVEGDVEAALGLTKQLLHQAFPTMTIEQIGKLTMRQMNKLVELAHGRNGQAAGAAEAAAAAEASVGANPQKAG